MRNIILFLVFAQISLANYGQVVADHTVVDKFDDIPQYYIDQVKKMLVTIPGESHSAAYRTGALLLRNIYPAYAVSVVESGTPEAYTTSNLRLSRATWGNYSNETGWVYACEPRDWGAGTPYDWIYDPVQAARVQAGLSYAHANNLTISAFGYGFCYNNGLCNSYITATQAHMDYCIANNLPTKVFFSTGPVDDNSATEENYLNTLRWSTIRTYVLADSRRILFDYADILCYNDAGELSTQTWNGNTFNIIHPDNMEGTAGTLLTGHIGANGCLRIGKALWWMLARMAGWDGGTANVPVSGITIAGAGGSSTISTDNGTLQLTAAVTPSNATNKTVIWSITNGTGQATISSSGLVTAQASGTVTARATASDGSGVSGTILITITNQVVPVSGITVTGAAGASAISTDNGTLQLAAAIAPANATNQSVTWTITNGTGQATISPTGLVTAQLGGIVTARATANDGSGVYGQLVITITNQFLPVTNISVTGSSVIGTDNGSSQLTATVLPSNATTKSVTWSISSGSSYATITSTGLVTAINNGVVTARATANDGSGVYGTLVITISNQVIPVTGITVSGAGGSSTITTNNGTLQLTAVITPANATNQSVTWTITNGTGQATISPTGLVTAQSGGIVTARATANDGSAVYGQLVITIANQFIPVTNISVTGSSVISTNNGSSQLTATVLPSNATTKSVTWSISIGSSYATISSSGLVSALNNGTVTVRATANDGSGIYGTLVITITNQIVPVTGISVTGAGGLSTISTDNGTLQLTAAVSPSNATNHSVTWSITNGTGQATISSTGLVTAQANGTVIARATANDGSGIYGTLLITISGQMIPVISITVTGAGGAATIATDNGTLQLMTTVSPVNATNKNVTWTITNGTGQATINSTGIVTAQANGTITARATAADGSGVSGTLLITITNQVIPVAGIIVTGVGGATTIATDKGTLQLTVTVSPANATNKNVTWTVTNGTGQATISSTGILSAQSNGTVTARASAADGSGVYGIRQITISNQSIPVTGIKITVSKGSPIITTDNGSIQLSLEITPSNATKQTVLWSVSNRSGIATISSSGIITAEANGMVTVIATAADGSGITGSLDIEIQNQVVPVTSILITGEGGITTINSKNSLQLYAAILPEYANDRSVNWSVINGTGSAQVSPEGLVTGLSDGIVTVRAEANDGSGVYATYNIEIRNYQRIKAITNSYEIRVTVPERFLNATLNLLNLNGSALQNKKIDSSLMIFEISGLPCGIYIITVHDAFILDATKVIKLN